MSRGELQVMFSQTTEYALRAVVILAHLNEEGAVGAKLMAEKAQVPASYLSKIMQSLVKAGLVHSKRGAGGGFVLTRSPEEISILDVVNAVGSLRRINTCPLGLKSHAKVLCPMHARLDLALANIEEIFATSTIAELLSDPERPLPMVECVEFLGNLSQD